MACGSSSAGEAAAAQMEKQQKWTDQATQGINQAFSGFTPQFYKGIGQAYQNFAMPQLQQQYSNIANNLGFKMANQGLLNSSVNQNAQNQLAHTMSQAQTQLGNQAVGQENQLRSQVNQQQSNLLGQAASTNAPGNLINSALSQAQTAQAPSTFQPIGQMFNTFAQDYLGAQNANMYNQFANQYLNTLNNPGLYGQLGQGNNFGGH